MNIWLIFLRKVNDWIKNIKSEIKPHDIPWLFLFFVLPVFPSLISSSIVLIIISLLLRYKSCIFNFSENKLLLLPLILYLSYMIGLLFTESEGMKAIVAERKLSLLIFPLIFLFKVNFEPSFRKWLWGSFSMGLMLYVILSFFGSIQLYSSSKDINSFFSSAFSYELHPSYSALYLSVAILYFLHHLTSFYNQSSTKHKLSIFIIVLIFSFTVFLLSSKAGIISLFLVYLLSFLNFANKKKKLKYVMLLLLLAVIFLPVLYFLNPVPLQRFKNMFEASSIPREQLFKDHHASTESNVVRRMIWTVSCEIIRDNPFGVGSGDANAELLKKYQQYEMDGALSKELNAHNQFLQTTLALGFPGLLLLLAFFIAPLAYSVRNKNFLMFVFVVLVVLNLSVESMLETESGIVFICLFYPFLLLETKKNREI